MVLLALRVHQARRGPLARWGRRVQRAVLAPQAATDCPARRERAERMVLLALRAQEWVRESQLS